MSFHGAAGGVTGSCHLLKVNGLKVLIDCGLFQGENQWRSRNYDDFGFDPASVDYLLLTHGHLDHCGRIPILVKKGFRGKIVCTAATYDITKIALMDSAHVQEEDYEQWKKINHRRGIPAKPPLYTTLDVLDCFTCFGKFAEYGKPVELNGKIRATFRDAGHILGSAFIEIEAAGEKRIVFSGDLGNRNKPVVRDPEYSREGDVVVIETTYGDRDHRDIKESTKEICEVIKKTFARGGNVVIPSFSIERSQELLFVLREHFESGCVPRMAVYLDSPMAIDVTNIMRRHPECFDEEMKTVLHNGTDPFHVPGLQMTKSQAASKQINFVKQGAVIIAGSGMCAGGRIRLHLKHNIWRKECSIVFMGFQAEGTLGRTIVDGAKQVNILGESYMVNAEVHTIGGFSSHADRGMLVDWLRHNNGIEKLFLVHGEEKAVQAFKATAEQERLAREVIVGQIHQKYQI